jgi:methylenetetrahydrofolate reductase (NADPH)
MKLSDLYGSGSPSISFELFPPRTIEALEALEDRLPMLIELGPSFISVTYGALGSNRSLTLEISSLIKNKYGIETAHHLTCVGSSEREITTMLEEIRKHNIENIVALRGDPPRGDLVFNAPADGFSNGDELVKHIRDFWGFGIAVAGYPEKHIEAPDMETDLWNLKRKVDSGADAIITQLYFDNSHFYKFVENCRAIGIEQPIVPGLMPILSVTQIRRITEMCGATIPADLMRKLEDAGDDNSLVHEIGIEHTARQAKDLLDNNVPGIHFYVLNRYFHIAEIMQRIC